mgnify:CR=1 FL=1
MEVVTDSSDSDESSTESLFVRMIDYGNAKDGDWNSNHMLVQVEDVLDVWNTCVRTSYIQPVCEFDHLSGHDSEREDGLTVSPVHLKMNWGKGRMMRDCELSAGCHLEQLSTMIESSLRWFYLQPSLQSRASAKVPGWHQHSTQD